MALKYNGTYGGAALQLLCRGERGGADASIGKR